MAKQPSSHLVPRFQLDFHAFRELLKVLAIVPSAHAPTSRFACHLALYFPEAASHIDETMYGDLHMEVGVLKTASAQAISREDWNTLSAHYAFAAALLNTGGGELRNGLHVSYLGSLFYGETSRQHATSRSLLPRKLAHALERIERHYEEQVI